MQPTGTPPHDAAREPSPAATVYEFGPFRLDPANRLLATANQEVKLPGRAFDALLLLVQRPGGLVTKEELMSSVWSGSFVEESNLTVAISTLRRALNDDQPERRYIQTVARRGYRFIAEVTEVHAAPRETLPTAMLSTPQPLAATTRTIRFNWRWIVPIAAALLLAAVFSFRLLKPKTPLAPHPAEAARTPRPDDPAYQLYLRGRYFWNKRTVDGLRKSADYFKQSIDANPNYAPAYAGLADSYALLASFSVEPGSSANADARSAALSAIHLDPTLAEPHASLGMIYFFTDWNLAAADQEFQQSIRLDPNYATAHHWYALALAAQGRHAQALAEIHTAQKLDPVSLIIGTNVGWIEYLAHDFPAATADLHRVLELDPNFARARTRLGMVEMATGDNTAAIRDLTQALSVEPDPWVEGLLGDAEARSGNRAAAEKRLRDLSKPTASRYVPPISRALVLIGLDRKADALAALNQAVDDHSTSMVYARVDPALDPLRGDPAFPALLSRMKL